MGLTLSIGLAPAVAHVPCVFPQVLQRLRERGTIVAVEHYTKYSLEQPLDPPMVVLTDLQPFLQHLVPSRDALKLRLQYPVAPGHAIGFDLYCYGRGFNAGHTVLFNGHIRMVLEHGDLYNTAHVVHPLPDAIEWVGSGRAWNVTLVEELFLRACGLYDPPPHPLALHHAALYPETKWPAAAWCSLLYHREVTAFAHDFWDIYAHYHWGLTPMRQLYGDLVRGMLEPPALPHLPTECPMKELLNPGPPGTLQYFLEQLDRPTVERLTHLSSATLRALLLQAGDTLPGVVCYDFGARGMVLATDPTCSLWRVYAYIAQHAP